jgi:hypothetical protein
MNQSHHGSFRALQPLRHQTIHHQKATFFGHRKKLVPSVRVRGGRRRERSPGVMMMVMMMMTITKRRR